MLDTENRTTFNGNKSRLENLELLDQIHQDALSLLGEAGVKCDSSEVRRIFGATGSVAFDESIGHLYVLAPFVEQSLAPTPKRDHYWIPRNSFGVGGTAPFIFDGLTKVGAHPPVKHPTRIMQKIAGYIETLQKGMITVFNFIQETIYAIY